jgi:hypothetical protein
MSRRAQTKQGRRAVNRQAVSRRKERATPRRPTTAQIERWIELHSTTHSQDGEPYGDLPKFEAFRKEVLAYLEPAERLAVALRDPFAPGAAAVIAQADHWNREEDWGSELRVMGEALDWGLRGADEQELKRLQDENAAKWAAIADESTRRANPSPAQERALAVLLVESWLPDIIKRMPLLTDDERRTGGRENHGRRSGDPMSALKSSKPGTIAQLNKAVAARFRAEHGDDWDDTMTYAAAKRALYKLRDDVARLCVAADDPFAPGAGKVLTKACLLFGSEHVFEREGDWLLQQYGEALLHGADEAELERLREDNAPVSK